MKKLIIYLCVVFFTFNLAYAQPILVDNIPPKSTNFISMEGLLFYTSNDSLFRSDGTASGTILLQPGLNNTHEFLTNNGLLYFIANSSEQLWRSDGTPAGTFMLAESFTAVPHLNIMGVLGGKVVFEMSHSVYDIEPFITDGTVAGTELLKDIYPGYNPSLPRVKGILNSEMYFAGLNYNSDISSLDYELWKTDGTTGGTVQVKDINPSGTAFPLFSPAVNTYATNSDYVFFIADDGVHGPELWRSDGTESGTVMVKDIVPGTSESHVSIVGSVYKETHTPRVLTEAGGIIYFFAGSIHEPSGDFLVLWKSDGTSTGTVPVKEIPLENIQGLFELNDKLIIVGNYGIAYQVWASDGTEPGTIMVKDHLRGGDNYLGHFIFVGNHLVFTDNIQGYDYQLWKTDGTPAGTELIREMHSAPGDLVAIDDKLFFTEHGVETYYEAGDGINDFELWQSDLTPGGTFMVKDIAATSFAGSHNLTNVDGTLYFTTSDPVSSPGYLPVIISKQLWKYNIPASMISELVLVDSDTDTDIRTLALTDTVYMDQNVNFRAVTNGDVESVRFYINDVVVRTENQAPYALAGDNSGNYHEWNKEPGLYKIAATPFTGNNGSGVAGNTLVRYVRVLYPTDTAAKIAFILMDAASDAEIRPLHHLDTVYISPGEQISVKAVPAHAESVVFLLNGGHYRTENAEPFALAGDAGGNFHPWYPVPGEQILIATAYAGHSGTGRFLQSHTIHFEVIVRESALRVAIHPNPIQDIASVSIESENDQQVHILLTDYMGRIYLNQQTNLNPGENRIPININQYDLTKGIYFVKIVGEKEKKVVTVYKE